jgi:predicted RNA-binding Zn-ribbon protein involved in translation (DUF1610 family)
MGTLSHSCCLRTDPVTHLSKIDLRRVGTRTSIEGITGADEGVSREGDVGKIGMINIVRTMPSVTATWVACPQCGEAATIKSIVPCLEPKREDRTFECRECGLPRTYSMKLN